MYFVIFILSLLVNTVANAQLKEYEHTYDIDLNEDIPMTWRLQEEYKKETSNYYWKYKFSWNIFPVFDVDFRKTIKDMGSIEKRISSTTEDQLYRDLQRIPKAFYPYIGPNLHNVPGISGKILDLPGIKETKNKFPEKIASRFKNIPYIEYLSPALYIYLMPQIWGEDMESLEFPQTINKLPRINTVRIKPEFIDKIFEKVPAEKFALNRSSPKNKLEPLRHYSADKNTPLSTSDVKAFINTLDDLVEFQNSDNNHIKFLMIDSLIQYWDEKNGTNRDVTVLKNMVNPCQAIARKVKWLGIRAKFQEIIGKSAFGIDDWAYTCDKTIKAYRVSKLNNSYSTSLRLMKKGYPYKIISQYGYYTPEERDSHKNFIEASIQLYDSKPENIEAIKPFKSELYKKFLKIDNLFLGSPIVIP